MTYAEREVTIDRRAVAVMLILLAVAVAVNVDRLVLGTSAPLRAHDVADNTVTGLASCGDFWRSSLRSTWDPTQLRGWPRAGSPQHPELFMCVAAAVVPPAYILPLYHAVLLPLIAVGSFLFVLVFLRRSAESAVAAAVLDVALYFFFHEHPIVPSAILLPPLAGFLSVPGTTGPFRLLRFTGAALVMGLANPPPTLVLMPLGHLALVLCAPARERSGHVIRCVAFWAIYAVFFGPAMIAMLREFGDSSRSLYRPPVTTGTFRAIFHERLLNPAVLSPAFVLFALIGRRTWRATGWLVAALLAFVVLATANQVLVQEAGARFPVLVSLSSTYYRMYYFVPVALLVWAAWLFDDLRDARRVDRVRQATMVAAFCLAAVWLTPPLGRVFLPYWTYAAAIGVMAVSIPWWTARPARILVVTAVIFGVGRYEFTRVYEVPLQGNLFVEEPHGGAAAAPVRTVTVMNDCDAVDLYPAQARVAGDDTLDGISNYYARGFAERWRYFVSDNPFSCTARYAGWNTRAELTLGDLRYNADRILDWLWINNVGFVRSPAPLTSPRLRPAGEKTFTADRTHPVTRYLYRVESPVGRVFTIPNTMSVSPAAGDFEAEARALDRLQAEPGSAVVNVAARIVNGSHLRFSGAFDADRVLVVNMNYHRGWRVRLDGGSVEQRAEPGPFGMIRVPITPGLHEYDVVFSSPVTPFVPAFMLAGLVLLWISTGVGADMRPAAFPWRTPSWHVGWGVLLLLGIGGAAAVAMWRPISAGAAWPEGGWRYRLPLRTAGVPTTGRLVNFPIRVEVTPADTSFWSAQRSLAGIRFTDAGGSVSLPFEIERFDPDARDLVAWVRVPQLRPGSQDLGYLYFGSPDQASAVPIGRVWDDYYQDVWHDPPAEAPGGFDVGGEDWTLEFSLRAEPLAGRNFGLFSQGPPGAFDLYLHNGGYLVLERQNGPRLSEVAFPGERLEPSTQTWIAIGRTRNQVRIAVNGRPGPAVAVQPVFDHAPLPGPLTFGRGRYGALSGRLGEVRISRGIARSADWTLASYAAQQPGFVVIGPMQRPAR